MMKPSVDAERVAAEKLAIDLIKMDGKGLYIEEVAGHLAEVLEKNKKTLEGAAILEQLLERINPKEQERRMKAEVKRRAEYLAQILAAVLEVQVHAEDIRPIVRGLLEAAKADRTELRHLMDELLND